MGGGGGIGGAPLDFHDEHPAPPKIQKTFLGPQRHHQEFQISSPTPVQSGDVWDLEGMEGPKVCCKIQFKHILCNTHTIHGTGILTYIYS